MSKPFQSITARSVNCVMFKVPRSVDCALRASPCSPLDPVSSKSLGYAAEDAHVVTLGLHYVCGRFGELDKARIALRHREAHTRADGGGRFVAFLIHRIAPPHLAEVVEGISGVTLESARRQRLGVARLDLDGGAEQWAYGCEPFGRAYD